MRLAIIGLAGLASVALAYPSTDAYNPIYTEPDYSLWQAPLATDDRAPCPAMNSLANHGAINRNGRNITFTDLADAIFSFLNIEVDFTISTIFLTLDNCPDPTLACGTFNLKQLKKHGTAEHDVSLSRKDFALGGIDGSTNFDLEIWNTVMATLDGAENFSLAIMQRAHTVRVQDSVKNNPNLTYTGLQYVGSMVEACVGMAIMSNPEDMNPSAEYMNEGWKRSPTLITLANLATNVLKMQLTATNSVEEGSIVTVNTIQSAYNGNEIHGISPCWLMGTPCYSS